MTDERHEPTPGFASWYEGEHPRLLAAMTVAAGEVEMAREATDEAFVRAYERWDTVRRMDAPGGWLYRVALNELRRRHRRQRLERELLRRQHRPPALDGPAPVADPRVWHAVRDLPRRQRSAVALRYVLDLTEREVGETMGISRGAASALLSSARRNLERALGEHVTDEPGRVGIDG
ncbi:MAG: sigma-70 family RNA polymerase sigma factor [Actinomycetota bacterium]